MKKIAISAALLVSAVMTQDFLGHRTLQTATNTTATNTTTNNTTPAPLPTNPRFFPDNISLGCGACIRGGYIYCVPGPRAQIQQLGVQTELIAAKTLPAPAPSHCNLPTLANSIALTAIQTDNCLRACVPSTEPAAVTQARSLSIKLTKLQP